MPDHLRATFRVVDDRHRPLATGKDLMALRREVAQLRREALRGTDLAAEMLKERIQETGDRRQEK